MKREVGILLLVLAVGTVSVGFAPPAPTSRPAPRNLAVSAMRTIIEDADFKKMPFEEFVEWLERTTQATVVVRWKLFDKAGVDRDQPITIQLKNVPLRKIIELVLDQLKRDDPSVRLAAKADDNTLLISTVGDLYRENVTRSYNIQDLLISVPDFAGGKAGPPTGQPAAELTLIRPQDRGKDPKTEEKAQRLMEMITTHIQPESWKINGGKGTISFFKGQLIIRNNLLVHQQLGGGSPPSLLKP